MKSFSTQEDRLSQTGSVNTFRIEVQLGLLILGLLLACTRLEGCQENVRRTQKPVPQPSASDPVEKIRDYSVDPSTLKMATNLTWEALQIISEQHIDPPLLNQLILDGIGRMAPKQKRILYRQISGMKSKEDFRSILEKALNFTHSAPRAQEEPGQNVGGLTAEERKNPVAIANFFLESKNGSPRLVTAYQANINRQLAENRYVGIGIAVRQNDPYTLVDRPFRGGPAHQAGIIRGDRILKVDGNSMVGSTLGQVVMALRGPKDSAVDVVVSQPGQKERLVTLKRGVVPIASVRGVSERGTTDWDFIIPEKPKVAYIEITNITGSTAAELNSALRQISRQKIQGLVLDLRGCRQAELHHLLMVTDVLVSSNSLGHWTDARGQKTEMKLRSGCQVPETPIAVIATPSQTDEVKILIEGLINFRQATLVGQLASGPALIHQNVKLPSGVGTIERVPVGWASVTAMANQKSKTQLPSHKIEKSDSGRQIGELSLEIDSLIRSAIQSFPN